MQTQDPLDVLRAFVDKHKTIKAAADALGMDNTYLGDVLKGRRPASETLLGKLGLKRVVVKAK